MNLMITDVSYCFAIDFCEDTEHILGQHDASEERMRFFGSYYSESEINLVIWIFFGFYFFVSIGYNLRTVIGTS